MFKPLSILTALVVFSVMGYLVYSKQEQTFAPVPTPVPAKVTAKSNTMLIGAYQREIDDLHSKSFGNTYTAERKAARIRELEQKISDERSKP